MNRHFIIGNLTRDPESKTTRSGENYTIFTVAVNRRAASGQTEAEYMDVTAWRQLGETCARYLRKGKKVAVIGESRAYGWIRQDGRPGAKIEINARDVEFLSGGGADREPEAPAWVGQAEAAAETAAETITEYSAGGVREPVAVMDVATMGGGAQEQVRLTEAKADRPY